MPINVKDLQAALMIKGFNPGPIDGILGPMTEAAIVAFKRSVGLVPRPYVGPITLSKLGILTTEPVADELPWMREISKYMGYHEITNNAALKKWLKSDGATLGDPAKLPWCGDCVQTAIRLALPEEKFYGPLKQNPYWALNWQGFGEPSVAKYGAVGVFKRSGGGHVAFLIGFDPERNRYRVRGGNQSNSVSDTWIDGSRLVAIRKPLHWNKELPALPSMNSKGMVISENEV